MSKLTDLADQFLNELERQLNDPKLLDQLKDAADKGLTDTVAAFHVFKNKIGNRETRFKVRMRNAEKVRRALQKFVEGKVDALFVRRVIDAADEENKRN